jgi:hypothetical protein
MRFQHRPEFEMRGDDAVGQQLMRAYELLPLSIELIITRR